MPWCSTAPSRAPSTCWPTSRSTSSPTRGRGRRTSCATRRVRWATAWVAGSTCRAGRSTPGPSRSGGDESAAVVEADPDADATDYAADKRGSELALERELGADRVTHLRAGLILGPRENVGRLPWWLRRIARGGDVLAPGPHDLGIQYVDARDLAHLGLDAGAAGRSGPVDVVSPAGGATMGGLLDACVEVTGSGASLVWLDEEFVLGQGLEPVDGAAGVDAAARRRDVRPAQQRRRPGARVGSAHPSAARDGRRRVGVGAGRRHHRHRSAPASGHGARPRQGGSARSRPGPPARSAYARQRRSRAVALRAWHARGDAAPSEPSGPGYGR